MQKHNAAAADLALITKAVEVLHSGRLVAFPTETVYGLGADATNPAAAARIYEAKGRPHFNPLISHVPTLEKAFELGIFSDGAKLLAEAFWPGPMTLVVPVSDTCVTCELARAGLYSIAIRVPSNPLAQALLTAFGKPVVAPSANRSGHVSPTKSEHVRDDLGGRVDLILEGGSTEFGLESSIFVCLGTDITLLRPGSITREMAEAALGQKILEPSATIDDTAPLAPGQLSSHYAPRAALRLNAVLPNAGEAFLAFGPQSHPLRTNISENLSERADLSEAAANLYAMLRKLDLSGTKTIAVSPIPEQGLGEAIMDRLRRAAAPR